MEYIRVVTVCVVLVFSSAMIRFDIRSLCSINFSKTVSRNRSNMGRYIDGCFMMIFSIAISIFLYSMMSLYLFMSGCPILTPGSLSSGFSVKSVHMVSRMEDMV